MSYELLFLTELPAFVLIADEEHIRVQIREKPEKISAYLGEKAEWESRSYCIGFGKCGALKPKGDLIHVTFLLTPRSLRRVLLTLSLLLQKLNESKKGNGLLSVESSCGRPHWLSGNVSAEFRRRLLFLSKKERGFVLKNMRRTFAAVSPPELTHRSSRCHLSIDEVKERFILGCFLECKIGIYDEGDVGPGKPARFTSRHLISDFQQATLLAGLLTLYSYIKKVPGQ